MAWFDVAQDSDMWWAFVIAVRNLRVPSDVGNSLTRLGLCSLE